MGIGKYIKEIGRGKDGARPLTREQAADLFGQVLDGTVTDLEIGGFCLAMRIKGETAQEMAGFLDATHQRLKLVPEIAVTPSPVAPLPGASAPAVAHPSRPVIVIPSYNGARKLPVLTPLLALLLAREGLPVLVHGTATEPTRVYTSKVLSALGIPSQAAIKTIANGEIAFAPTELLCVGLARLLDVRRVVGLRNPAHSVVKLMNPCAGKSLIVSSYTHPEYAISMAATFELMQSNALLLRGTEGEAVADPRRMPQMDGFVAGQRAVLQEAQTGTLPTLPELPKEFDAETTAAYIQRVMAGNSPVPPSIARQVEHILLLSRQL
jgi:anthranilate phosphoribosyltransferase